jgi:outer membrane receptor protein involved in Fe transport
VRGARLEGGVDVNGRYDLHALDIAESYGLDGVLLTSVENVSIDTARRVDTGVYASIEAAPVRALSIAGGVRGDYVTTRNEGGFFGDRSTGNGAGSGFVAVTIGSFGGFSTTAQVARGFRDPMLSDRYYRGPSGRGFITGNPNLDPETSLQFDVGLRYTSPRLRAATYFYHYRINDLIERFQTQTDFFFFRNRGRARLRGFEAEAQATLAWGMSLESAFHWARGHALDDGTYLDDIAPETFSIQLRRGFAWRSAFAQVRTAWYAEDPRPGPTEIAVPGYTMLDAASGISLVDSLDIRVSARNLLNDDYMASQDPRTVAAPGRSVAVSLVFRIGG